MAELVRCKDCEHLFHDAMKRVPKTMLSCRVKQNTPEQRATYMGTEWPHACEMYFVRKATTVNPLIAAEEEAAANFAAFQNAIANPTKKAVKPKAPDLFDLTPPRPAASKPVPEVRSNSPFDLGARPAPQPAPVAVKAHDPFDLEAASA